MKPFCQRRGNVSVSRSAAPAPMDQTEADATVLIQHRNVVMPRNRRPWGTRRRTRSTGSLPFSWYQKQSEDSSSSVGQSRENKGMSSLHQSDSDDVSGIQGRPGLFSLQTRRPPHLLPNLESDSVNENFSPIRPSTRRKRKFKRMAVDVEMASTSSRAPIASCVFIGTSGKKKRILKHAANCENRFCAGLRSGKRKRSVRPLVGEVNSLSQLRSEEATAPQPAGMEVDEAPRSASVLSLQRLSLREEPTAVEVVGGGRVAAVPSRVVMAVPPLPLLGTSSVSSSESDTGIFTNDEGREGDDEQSDWFGEGGNASGGGVGPRGWWEDSCSGERSDMVDMALLTAGLAEHMTDDAKCAYNRILAQQMSRGGREIRGGRRRVRSEKPGFSVLTSANEKLSRFLQDSSQSELRLHPMHKKERDQLCHLAELYSLNMCLTDTSRKGLTCPVLTKTSNTMRGEPVSMARLHTLSDFKRRKKTPPSCIPTQMDLSSIGVTEGSPMLDGVNWDGRGMIIEPSATKSKCHHALGHKSC